VNSPDTGGVLSAMCGNRILVNRFFWLSVVGSPWRAQKSKVQKRVTKSKSARINIDCAPINGDRDETSKINSFENEVKEPRISAGAYALRANSS